MSVGSAGQSPIHVVIIGGGFAGLAAARAVAGTPCRVTLVDRRNHHVFQPLLYQVATAALSPAQISSPIRTVFAGRRNVDVVLSEARSIDVASRTLRLSDGELKYDALVVAAGATHSYFGRDEWARHAPGLKTIQDALTIRSEFLDAFERADRERDPEQRRAELTFVIVGGGPTGVETAGAMAEIARFSISREYRHIDTKTARVILVEGQGRLLPAFPEELSARTKRDLEGLGVEVRLNCKVVGIDAGSVDLETAAGREHLPARHIVWAAGVKAEPIAATLGAPIDRAGRVMVGPDLSVPGHPEVFVVGDLAHVPDGKGNMVPGVAPAAMQMGKYVGSVLAAEIRAGAIGKGTRRPFVYRDKGTLATIGRARAVALVSGMKLTGFVAWALWALVHVFYLISFRTKLLVMLEWAWSYVFFHRGARIIYRELNPDPPPGPGESRPLT